MDGQTKYDRAWNAWFDAAKDPTQVTYGVVMTSQGNKLYSLNARGQVEEVTMGGYATIPSRGTEDNVIAWGVDRGRFMVVQRPRGQVSQPMLRVYPPLTETCSRKSASPKIGGLGMVSAV